MLVLMTGVAMLLNHEVQRAKTIEVTVSKIELWNGKFRYIPRKNIPSYVVERLPRYWGLEIHKVKFLLFSEALSVYTDNRVVNMREEFKKLFELSALRSTREVWLVGNAIDYSLTSKLLEQSAVERCSLEHTTLSDEEINELKETFPHCKFYVMQRRDVKPPNW